MIFEIDEADLEASRLSGGAVSVTRRSSDLFIQIGVCLEKYVHFVVAVLVVRSSPSSQHPPAPHGRPWISLYIKIEKIKINRVIV